MESLTTSLSALGDEEVVFRAACMAVRHLQPCGNWSDIPPPVQTAIQVIRAVRGSSGHGVFWQGRPRWLTPERLRAMDEEAVELHPNRRPFVDYHHWTPSGPHGNTLMRDEARAFAEGIMGRTLGEAFATYNYYDKPGEQAFSHVDQPEYQINLLGLLSHEHDGNPQSALWVYPEGQAPFEVVLTPGDFVLFHGGSTVHQRTPLGANERLRVVTSCFLAEPGKIPFP